MVSPPKTYLFHSENNTCALKSSICICIYIYIYTKRTTELQTRNSEKQRKQRKTCVSLCPLSSLKKHLRP